MNVTLRQIQAFVLVARLGSFTRAAQAMHLTQSALSLLVREFEGAIESRLFDRTTLSRHPDGGGKRPLPSGGAYPR
ncbi:LysR family transcriptional regulator [Polaromonas sp. P1(28)-8]|nr:LysR family transcriptional regulator [Polaromonas sp. P1(28)-8]